MLFNDGRVVSNFIVQALTGNKLTVYGQGEQTRSFCFASDLVSGIMATMNVESYHDPINLGNPNEMTVISLAHLIKDLTGSKSVIEYLPLPKDDPTRRQPDISRAKEILKWQPAVPVRQGLIETIKDFETRLAKGETV
jgi:UDP-glucuronate decarboxylase